MAGHDLPQWQKIIFDGDHGRHLKAAFLDLMGLVRLPEDVVQATGLDLLLRREGGLKEECGRHWKLAFLKLHPNLLHEENAFSLEKIW